MNGGLALCGTQREIRYGDFVRLSFLGSGSSQFSSLKSHITEQNLTRRFGEIPTFANSCLDRYAPSVSLGF